MQHFIQNLVTTGLLVLISSFASLTAQDAATVKLGLNYPKTGPYSVQGLDQLRAAELARDEINENGGILGKQVELVLRDTKSKPTLAAQNARDLIDNEGVQMLFGGSSSGVAVAVGKIAQEKQVPFFGTLTYSTSTTGQQGRRFVFRECYDSWAAANVLADYMNKNFKGKKFLYITADYNWGHTTEASFRELSGTTNTKKHRVIKSPFPGATEKDFRRALSLAKLTKPDVLVLVLFGGDMVQAVRMATTMGLKSKSQIVVPNLTLGMAEGGGPKVMESVVGALPWTWRVPEKVGSQRGQDFVDAFAKRHKRYPGTSGASAYTILYEYKDAAERSGSFAPTAIVHAMEGHEYTLLKDSQTWRSFDHQSVQTVFAVRCKAPKDVMKDRFKLDYFEILSSLSGDLAFIDFETWKSDRVAAGVAPTLKPLPAFPAQPPK